MNVIVDATWIDVLSKANNYAAVELSELTIFKTVIIIIIAHAVAYIRKCLFF